MRLFIIRHGQSHNNLVDFESTSHEEYIRRRHADPDLTPLGWRQAEAVATHLATATTVDHLPGYDPYPAAGYCITRLFCSPMRRAMQTAQPIAREIGVAPEIHVDIYEFGGMYTGDYQKPETCVNYPGMTPSEIESEFPGYIIPDSITNNGWYSGSHELHETSLLRIKRAASFFHELAAESNRQHEKHEHVAIVVHADFSNFLLQELLGHSETKRLAYLFHNTSITMLEFVPSGSIRVGYVNRSQHLTADVYAEA